MIDQDVQKDEKAKKDHFKNGLFYSSVKLQLKRFQTLYEF